MTNHIHLIFTCSDAIKLINSFKTFTSKAIYKLINEDNRRYLKESISNGLSSFNKIWIGNNWPEIVGSEAFFREKLEYIHNNPVKKGYVDKPEEWKYSSARNYILGDHSIIKIETEGF